MTAGPWRPVSLHTYHTHISDLHASAKVNENLEADLTVRVLLSPSETPCTAEVLLKDPSGDEVTGQSKITMNGGTAQVTFQFKKGDIRLWYPVGYGEQPLYGVHVKVFDGVRPNMKERNRVLTQARGGSKAAY
jgi:beta-mannosidase